MVTRLTRCGSARDEAVPTSAAARPVQLRPTGAHLRRSAVQAGCVKKGRAMVSRLSLSSVVICFLCGAVRIAAAQPGDSAWLVQVSGAVQANAARYVNWYRVPPTVPPNVGWESAVNGFRGPSVGIDAACEYRIADRFSIGAAASFLPTPLEATVHRGTAGGIVIADPEPSILFTPLRFTATYDLLRGTRWRFRMGGQVGMGLYRPTDARPEFGRSRHFSAGPEALLGGHVGVLFTGSRGWGTTIGFQYLRTGLQVEELGTGDLSRSMTHESFALVVGVHRAFGRRR